MEQPILKLSDMRSTTRIAYNWFIVNICKKLHPSELKNKLYRHIGVQIGKNVWISPDVVLDPVFPELIRIGDDVFIGWGTKIFTHQIDTDRTWKKDFVVLGNNCFIGGDCTIRCGVVVGVGAVVASNTLVNKNVPSFKLAIGIPMRIEELK